MAGDDTTTVLDEAGTSGVKLMLSKLVDHDVTFVFETVGGTGPISILAAEVMRNRQHRPVSAF